MKIPKILGKETVEILNWVNRFSENACNKINMGSWGEEGGKAASEMSIRGKKGKEEKILKSEASSAPLQYLLLGIAANSCWKQGFGECPGAVVKVRSLRAHLMLQDNPGPKGLVLVMSGVFSGCEKISEDRNLVSGIALLWHQYD